VAEGRSIGSVGPAASLKRVLGSAVKVAAAGADVLRPSAPGLVILIYHRIGGGSGSPVDLPVELFDEQVGELAAAQRIVTLDEGISRLAAGVLDDRPIVLTFDDGTTDWVDRALPVLARHGAPATFYVATDFVERRRPFPGDVAPISWAGLGELAASGLATIGSHTHSHALLDRADAATAAAELDRSIELIGDRLGLGCDHFAYPKALLGSPEAEAQVRRRFRSATIAGTRANHTGGDLHRLHRTPIQITDGRRWFDRKAAGGMRLEDTARAVLNRGRYAGATT
jgi:peptidoglycan/xylan/chitin deacetylase (PgdA/CDA1 family)